MDQVKLKVLESPVFVVGPLRSGTTLLRLMLGHHPEMNFFGEFETAVSQGSNSGWPDIKQFHEFLKYDRQSLGHKLKVDEQLNYESLIKSFLDQLYDRKPRQVIGASIHSRMDLIPRLWPKARFIHLLRDPRDVARSCIHMNWVGNVFDGSKYWIQPEKHWDTLQQQVSPEQIYTVRYEQLVAEPEIELRKICQFLQIEFDESMIDLSDTTYSKPNSKYANQWKDKLTDREINWIEYRCKELMVSREYPLRKQTPKKPSFFEFLYFDVQSVLHRISSNIKKWGFMIWAGHTISKRFGPKRLKNYIQLKINDINRTHLK